jgi:hypothetical protein
MEETLGDAPTAFFKAIAEADEPGLLSHDGACRNAFRSEFFR